MVIAIDIDDTVYRLSKKLDRLTRKYLSSSPVVMNKDKYWLEERYPELQFDFSFTYYLWNSYESLYNKRMIASAKREIKKIMEKHDVVFLTNRSTKWIDDPDTRTRIWLAENLNIPLSAVNLITNVRSKSNLAKVLNIDILIDNSPDEIKAAKGKIPYLFHYVDRHCIQPRPNPIITNVFTVRKWKGISDYVNAIDVLNNTRHSLDNVFAG